MNGESGAGGPRRYALVGCGANKIVTSEPVEIRELYTSSYYRQKREFAERHCEHYWIVSAEYGAVPPWKSVHTYDRHIRDVKPERWARKVRLALRANDARWVGNDAELWVLLGQQYIEPIRDVLDELDGNSDLGVTVRYPFADTSGIGEQRSVLSDLIESPDGEPVTESDADSEEEGDEPEPENKTKQAGLGGFA